MIRYYAGLSVVGAGGGDWSPDNPGGLVANYIPKFFAYTDTLATLPAGEGDKVAGFGDPSLVVATQGNVTFQPTLTGIHLLCDTNDYFQNVGATWIGAGDMTIVYSASISSSRSIYGESRTASSTDYMYISNQTGFLRIVLTNVSAQVFDIPDMAFSTTQREIRAITFANSTKTVNAWKYTSSLEASASNPMVSTYWPTASCDRSAVCARVVGSAHSDNFAGNFNGMLIYNKILTEAEIEEACIYLDSL